MKNICILIITGKNFTDQISSFHQYFSKDEISHRLGSTSNNVWYTTLLTEWDVIMSSKFYFRLHILSNFVLNLDPTPFTLCYCVRIIKALYRRYVPSWITGVSASSSTPVGSERIRNLTETVITIAVPGGDDAFFTSVNCTTITENIWTYKPSNPQNCYDQCTYHSTWY